MTDEPPNGISGRAKVGITAGVTWVIGSLIRAGGSARREVQVKAAEIRGTTPEEGLAPWEWVGIGVQTVAVMVLVVIAVSYAVSYARRR